MAKPKKKRPVVVLDQYFTAMGYIGFYEAVSKIYAKKAFPFGSPKDQFVQGPPDENGVRKVLPWPTMIVYTKYTFVEPDKLAPIDDILASRMGILKRDNFTCQYCGDSGATIDHIYPQWRGGENTWLNLVAACYECNGKKAGYTLEEINSWDDEELLERGFDGPMKLFREPFIPDKNKFADIQKRVWKMLDEGFELEGIEEYE